MLDCLRPSHSDSSSLFQTTGEALFPSEVEVAPMSLSNPFPSSSCRQKWLVQNQ